MKTLKVAGHDSLLKDVNTQGIVNDDSTAFERAVELKNKRMQEINRISDLENKLEQLETLLKKLLEGDN